MLTEAQLDRARGVLVGLAAGDALGAPYEFGPARGPELPIEMTGGGGLNWEPGEWTDDTSMAIVIARVAAAAADRADLLSTPAQDRIVAEWADWALSAPDVGIQTREVLAVARSTPPVTAAAAVRASAQQHARTGRTAGNGSLMRTSPVALAYLGDEDGLVQAAIDLSKLTHFDEAAEEACVLWCTAIRHAVLTGELDARVGLDRVPGPRRDVWSARITEAAAGRPADFPNNGWVVHAFQAAWSAIATTSAGERNRPRREGTGRSRALRLGHRHGRGDRRQPGRCRLWRDAGTGRLDDVAARLAGTGCRRSRRAGNQHRRAPLVADRLRCLSALRVRSAVRLPGLSSNRRRIGGPMRPNYRRRHDVRHRPRRALRLRLQPPS